MITEVGLMAETLVHRGRPGWRYWMLARNGRDWLTQVAGLLIRWCHHFGLKALAIVLPGLTYCGEHIVYVAEAEPRLT